MSKLSYLTSDLTPAKDWYGRGYPQYNAAVHVPMLQNVYRSCGGVAAFCAQSQISQKTFYSWLKEHPEFKQQYEISICEGSAIWELLPLKLAENGISLNLKYWATVMRQRYKYSVVHLNEEKEDTTSSRMKATWESLREGGINPQEFNQIASGLSTESRIAEVDLQKQAIDHVKESSEASKEMTDEALRAFMLVKSGKWKVVENVQI